MNDFLDSIANVCKDPTKQVTFSDHVQEKQISFAYSTSEHSVIRSQSQDTLLDDHDPAIDLSFDEPDLSPSDLEDLSLEELDQGVSPSDRPSDIINLSDNLQDTIDLKPDMGNDPPSSLFDFPVQTTTTTTIVETSETNRNSSPERTITKVNSSPDRKVFSWNHITTPLQEKDPFMDEETVKATKVKQFVISSPFQFSNTANRVLEDANNTLDRQMIRNVQVEEDQQPLDQRIELDQRVEPPESFQAGESREMETRETNESMEDDESRNPFSLYHALEKEGGSLVMDDFFLLKQQQQQDIEEEFLEGDVLEQRLSQCSFLSEKTVKEIKEKSELDMQTPQTLSRTLPSFQDELFSPGSFFASRSGNLGRLGGPVNSNGRPMWYTPKHDEHGRLIDPIGQTPAERKEKSQSGTVRPPLYVETPKSVSRIAPSNSSQMERSFSPQQPPSSIEHVDISMFELKSTSIETSLPGTNEPLQTKEVDMTDKVQYLEEENSANMIVYDTKIQEELELACQGGVNEFADVPEFSHEQPESDPLQKSLLDISVPNQVDLEKVANSVVDVSSSTEKVVLKIPPKPGQQSGSEVWQLRHMLLFSIPKKSFPKRDLCIMNCSQQSCGWTLKQVGPVKYNKGSEVHLIEESIFGLDCSQGKLDPDEKQNVRLSFIPIRRGKFTVLFQLKANGFVIHLNIDICVGSKKGSISSSSSSSITTSDSSLLSDARSKEAFDMKRYLSGLVGESKSVDQSADHSVLHKSTSEFLRNSTTQQLNSTPMRTKELLSLPTPLVPTVGQRNLLSEETTAASRTTFFDSKKLWSKDQEAKQSEKEAIAMPPRESRPITPTNKGNAVSSPQTAIKITDLKQDMLPPLQNLNFETPCDLKPNQPKDICFTEERPIFAYNLMTPKLVALVEIDAALTRLRHIPLTPNSDLKLRAKLNERNMIDIDFGILRRGQKRSVNLKVCNPDHKEVLVKFAVTGIFSIPIREIKMTPRSFVIIPIRIAPTSEGIIREMMIIRKDDNMKRIHLLGSVV